MLHSKIDLPVVPNSGHSKSKGSENVNVILFCKSTLIGKGYGNLELICKANLSKKKKKKVKVNRMMFYLNHFVVTLYLFWIIRDTDFRYEIKH